VGGEGSGREEKDGEGVFVITSSSHFSSLFLPSSTLLN